MKHQLNKDAFSGAGENVRHVLMAHDGKMCWVIMESWWFCVGLAFGPTIVQRSGRKNPWLRPSADSGQGKGEPPVMVNGTTRPASQEEIHAMQKICIGTGFAFG